eukprot:6473146-Amphidinium_carterae.1
MVPLDITHELDDSDDSLDDDDDLLNNTTCIICADRPIEVTLRPCDHTYFCRVCIVQIEEFAREGTSLPQCPVCRAPIVTVQDATQAQVAATVPQLTLVRQILRASNPQILRMANASSARGLTMPWWIPNDEGEEHLIFQTGPPVLMPQERGLLPDTGAFDNLAGSQWIRAQAADASRHGMASRQEPLSTPTQVQGVGHGIQSCSFQATVPIGLLDDNGHPQLLEYSSPVLESTAGIGHIALLGAKSLEHNKVLLDTAAGTFTTVGPGGYKIEFSPGSRTYQMVRAPSGHWVLPINRFQQRQRESNTSNSSSSNPAPATSSSL